MNSIIKFLKIYFMGKNKNPSDMKWRISVVKNYRVELTTVLFVFLGRNLALAQESSGMMNGMQGGSCIMCGIGWVAMVLGAAVLLAIVVFFFKRK